MCILIFASCTGCSSILDDKKDGNVSISNNSSTTSSSDLDATDSTISIDQQMRTVAEKLLNELKEYSKDIKDSFYLRDLVMATGISNGLLGAYRLYLD